MIIDSLQRAEQGSLPNGVDVSSLFYHLGDDAIVLALFELLNDSQIEVAVYAASCLLNFQTQNTLTTCSIFQTAFNSAVNLFCDLLENEKIDETTRLSTLLSLSSAFRNIIPKKLVCVLGRLLKSCDERFRVNAAAILRNNEANYISEVIGILSNSMRSNILGLKFISAIAFMRMKIRESEWKSVLTESFANDDQTVLIFAIAKLATLGSDADEASRLLARLALEKQRPPEIVRAAVFAISEIGRDVTNRAFYDRFFLRMLRSRDPEIALTAGRGLKGCTNMDAQTISVIASFLSDSDPTIRRNAARILGEFGAEANPAIDIIIEQAKIENDLEAYEAYIETLGFIGEQAIPALTKLFTSNNPQLITFATYSLAQIGSSNAAYMASALLMNPNASVRSYASGTLGAMGPAAANAMPVILQLLENEDETYLAEVLKSVSHIGHHAHAAAPKLIEIMLNSKHPVIYGYSYSAIVNIGQDAIPALNDAYLKASSEGQEHIAELLKRFNRSTPIATSQTLPSRNTSDILLIEFMEIGKMFRRDNNPISGINLAKEFVKRKSEKTIDQRISTSAAGIRKRLKRLEDRLSLQEGRAADDPVILIDRSHGRKGGLTAYGNKLLDELTEVV